jgi:riboflavin synthase
MFTGIIKEKGKVISRKDHQDSIEMEISCNDLLKDIKKGDSICVNGCCLTVKNYSKNSFFSDISYSTIKRTSFEKMKVGQTLNLEDSLRPDSKLGGHFVTGHVDSITEITGIEKIGNSYKVAFNTPEDLKIFITPRGSIAIDGISLTVEEVENDHFSVAVIPHTFENTNLCLKKVTEIVNLEIDMIARYVYNFINISDKKSIRDKSPEKDRILKEKMVKHGFIK